ncbi:MAG: glycosyltransferase family 4 protein [Flavobacteriales bacterium]
MKFLLDARLLLPGKLDGIGWYTFELYRRVISHHPEHEFHLVFDRKPDPQFFFSPQTKIHVVGPPARHPWLFYFWYEWRIPKLAKDIGADFFFSPGPISSTRLSIPHSVTLHDLNFIHFPQDLPSRISKYLNTWTPRIAHAASRVHTVSQFSKEDIIRSLDLDASRVEVIYNAASAAFKPSNLAEQQSTRERLSQGAPYFIFVSSIHPRKNLVRLLQAFDAFKSRHKRAFKLLVVGERFWQNTELDQTWQSMEFRSDVVFTGAMEQSDLIQALSAATALAYVSYFEGFGIPLLEAFQSGVPVIAARASALPEVGGDAPIWVDPFSVDDMLRGLECAAFDDVARQQCIQRGHQRAKMFSWEQSAEQLWNSWMSLLP